MKVKHIMYTLLFASCFALGGAVAHLTLPEKARLTQEEAQHLVDKKYRVMGYLRPEDKLFEDKNAMHNMQPKQ